MPRGRSCKFPPETQMIFNFKPLGLLLGGKSGYVYVYSTYKVQAADVLLTAKRTKPPSQTMLDAKATTVQTLVGLTLTKVQGFSVVDWALDEVVAFIGESAPPLFLTFGEDIVHIEERHFDKKTHVSYFSSMLTQPPTQYTSMDVQRVTLLFFAANALNLMQDFSSKAIVEEVAGGSSESAQGSDTVIASYLDHDSDATKFVRKQDIIEWIYAQQLIPDDEGEHGGLGGFRGGSFLGIPFDNNRQPRDSRLHVPEWDRVNMASTHNALLTLLAVGDDLRRVNAKALLNTVRRLQRADGGVFAMENGECDMRFVFCACAICAVLGDWSALDKRLTVSYIVGSQAYDGGFGMGARLEGHGGATYVAVAALCLLDALHECNVEALLRWCIVNQGAGFVGRPQKPADSCYSFWIGAVLTLIGKYQMTATTHNRNALLTCQSGFGGFCKLPEFHVGDILHGYMALAGLSLMGRDSEHVKRTVEPLLTCSIPKEQVLAAAQSH